MPRVNFRLAGNADEVTVDCVSFGRRKGAPYCDALNRCYCLNAGDPGPEACKFRKPAETKKEEETEE